MSIISWARQRLNLLDGKRWSMYFGTDTWAGEAVSLDTAMQESAWQGCVKLYAQTIATLPIGLWIRQADGRQSASDHPLQRVVREEPNADQDAAEYWENKIAWLTATGNAVSEKHFDTNNPSTRRLVALDLLCPSHVSVERRPDGGRDYHYLAPGKAKRTIPEDRIFHLRGLSFGDELGINPLTTARQTLSTARATTRAASAHFANGMRPSGWLVYKGGATLEPDQREMAKQNLINPMIGAENAGKIGILEGDFDYRQMTITPEDAQLLDSRRFNVEEVCRFHGVPPILLSHASAGMTMWGSGVEQIVLGWYVLQLRPRLVRLERAMKRQLMRAEEKQNLYFEFNAEGLLRGDSAARAEFYWKMLQVGAMTPNQICDKENLPRFVGGDRHFVNTTLAPLDEEGNMVHNNNAGAPVTNNAEPAAPRQRRLEVVK
jgi:HK97 family phage portal protein